MNYAHHIGVNHLEGHTLDCEADADRAHAAAVKVLGDAGVNYRDAWMAHLDQIDDGFDHTEMTGLAAIWVQADKAANEALVEGWDKPAEGQCSIFM